MNKLTLSISTISVLIAIAGFKIFEDARVERCVTRLGRSPDNLSETMSRAFPEYSKGKSAEQIEKYQSDLFELRKSEQQNFMQWFENLNKCEKRITPPNWSNFFIDLTL